MSLAEVIPTHAAMKDCAGIVRLISSGHRKAKKNRGIAWGIATGSIGRKSADLRPFLWARDGGVVRRELKLQPIPGTAFSVDL